MKLPTKLIEEQLDFGKSIIDATLGEASKTEDFLGAGRFNRPRTRRRHPRRKRDIARTPALLKAKDPGFGGLVRVMNKRQEFLWVHESLRESIKLPTDP